MRAESLLDDFGTRIKEREVRDDTKKLLELIDNYSKFCYIFHWRRVTHPVEYLGTNADKTTILHFMKSNEILDHFSLETSRLLDASAVLMIGGYFESALSLVRIATERMICSLYFTFDHESFDKWERGEFELSIAKKGGMIDKFFDPDFFMTKMGIKAPFIERKQGKILKELYRSFSGIVHGEILASREIFAATSRAAYKHEGATKAAVDEAYQHVIKSELFFFREIFYPHCWHA